MAASTTVGPNAPVPPGLGSGTTCIAGTECLLENELQAMSVVGIRTLSTPNGVLLVRDGQQLRVASGGQLVIQSPHFTIAGAPPLFAEEGQRVCGNLTQDGAQWPAGTLLVESGGTLQVLGSALLELQVPIVLQAGASLQVASEGVLQMQGTMSCNGTGAQVSWSGIVTMSGAQNTVEDGCVIIIQGGVTTLSNSSDLVLDGGSQIQVQASGTLQILNPNPQALLLAGASTMSVAGAVTVGAGAGVWVQSASSVIMVGPSTPVMHLLGPASSMTVQGSSSTLQFSAPEGTWRSSLASQVLVQEGACVQTSPDNGITLQLLNASVFSVSSFQCSDLVQVGFLCFCAPACLEITPMPHVCALGGNGA
mgnify:FL=1